MEQLLLSVSLQFLWDQEVVIDAQKIQSWSVLRSCLQGKVLSSHKEQFQFNSSTALDSGGGGSSNDSGAAGMSVADVTASLVSSLDMAPGEQQSSPKKQQASPPAELKTFIQANDICAIPVSQQVGCQRVLSEFVSAPPSSSDLNGVVAVMYDRMMGVLDESWLSYVIEVAQQIAAGGQLPDSAHDIFGSVKGPGFCFFFIPKMVMH